MITQGRQYIEFMSIGGNRVAAMSRGRYNLSITPYSREATAALVAQFPTQWPTIRDYGFAHPEIVGYMNAYAPEDAKIAYSLVEGIGTRWLVNDANGAAYIDTGVKGNRNTEIEAKFKIGKNNSNLAITIFGTWVGATSENNAITLMFPLVGSTVNRVVRFGANMGNVGLSPQYSLNTEYTMRQDKSGCWINGTKVVSYNQTSTFTTPGTITFLRIKGAPTAYDCLSGHLASAKLGGDYPFYLIPFKRNGAMGMIDLLTGTFYGNANSSGSFTESIETPAS